MASKIGGAKIAKKAEGTRASRTNLKDQIRDIITQGNQEISPINKKIVLTGENGTSKSSIALKLLTTGMILPKKVPVQIPVEWDDEGNVTKTEEGMGWPDEDLKDHEFIFYVDVDNSGYEIANSFFSDYLETRRIILWKPMQTTTTDEGSTIVDEGETVRAIATAAATLQELVSEGYKIKGVVVDGISFVLQYCEAFMRDEKGLGADEGAKHQIWKIRNDKFREFKDPFMALPVPVIFIGHEDFIPEYVKPDQNFASVKQKLIDECSMRIILHKEESANTPGVEHYVATIKKDRSNVLVVNKEFIFMTVNNKEGVVDTDASDLVEAVFPKL